MALGSGALEGAFTYKSRFEEGDGTNPEELIGAAEAGCFTMQLSASLANAGHPVESVETDAEVSLRTSDEGPYIAGIKLSTRGRVPGIDEAAFREAAEEAKAGCIVSRALDVPIELEATLER
jgi:osmotically inducible protein OsmC